MRSLPRQNNPGNQNSLLQHDEHFAKHHSNIPGCDRKSGVIKGIGVVDKLTTSLFSTLLLMTFLLVANLAQGQLYNQSFTTINQGLDNCNPCVDYESPGYPVTANSWRILADSADLTGDYFKTVSINAGTDVVLEAESTGVPLCFETRLIDISSAPSVKFSVILSEIGNLENDDVVNVNFNVDSIGFKTVLNWQNDGTVTQTLIGSNNATDWERDTVQTCVSGSNLVIQVCITNNHPTELIRIEQVLVESEPLGSTARCTDCFGYCDECAFPPIAENPALAPCASLNIAFVIDESGSVADSAAQVGEGVLTFLNAITCPNAQVAIIEFNTTANYIIPDYTALDAAILDSMEAYFTIGQSYNGQSYDPADFTNWEHAMQLVDDIPVTPDLILLFTDGNPTAWDPTGELCGSGLFQSQRPEIVNAMKLANKMKGEGAHMFVLEVGDASTPNIILMSGPDVYEEGVSSIATSDYVQETFVNLASCLAQFAMDLCPFSACTATPTCPNMMNGSITVNITDQPASSTYTWAYTVDANPTVFTGSAATEPFVIPNLAAGLYDVSVSIVVSAGCTRPAGGCMVQVTNLLCNTTPTDPSNCSTSQDGSFDLGVIGGVPPYSYMITGGISGMIPMDDTITLMNFNPGVYDITVTDASASNCTSTCQVTIANAMNGPTCSIDAVDNETCNELNDGIITASASGGLAPYTFDLTGGASNTTGIFGGLMAGSYTITVTDANMCSSTCDTVVTQPMPLIPTCSSIPANGLLDCHGDTDGSVSVTASGGTAGYTYMWNNGATTMSISGLGIGTYVVTVTDTKGCTATCSKSITQPTPVTATCNSTPTNGLLDCNGDTDGIVSVTPGGGTPGYTYMWSNAGTTMSISGLAAGTYFVTVTDSKGCTATCSKTLTQPPPVTANCTSTPTNGLLDCNGDMDGSVSVLAGGGTAGYTYLWNNAATTMSITGLGAGTYRVTVTDSKGCTMTCSKAITQPLPVTAICTTTPANGLLDCNGDTDGSVSVTPGGGTAGYTYLWSNTATTMSITGLGVGTYKVTVTDSKGCTATCSKTITQPTPVTANCVSSPANGLLDCNGDTDGSVTVTPGGGTPGYTYLWSNGATTISIAGLGAGSYQVTVTDSKGCTATCSKTLTQPPPVSAVCNTIPTNGLLDCHGDTDGIVSVVAGGGTSGYTYVWNNGATTSSISGLGVGIYRVTVTDSKGCTATCNKPITEPPLLVCSITGTDVICNTTSTGTADASVTGGTMPYSYLWSNGATTQDIIGLSVGSYSLSVTDANNCLSTCSVDIGGFICSIEQTVCDLNNLRGATATVSGGTLPYTYLWSTGETTSSIDGLIPGTYSLIVTDAQECETECQVVIERCFSCDYTCETTFARLDNFATCFDQFGFSQWGWTNGILGVGNYVFDLYADAQFCNLNNGTLVGELLVDYANDTVIVTYNLFGNYTMSLTSLYVGCTDIPTNNGAQTISPSQYPYQQFHDQITSYTYVVDISLLPCEGIYVIAHAETCLPYDFHCDITGTSVDCSGGSTGMADATISGGLPPYRYLWSNSATTEDISGLVAGLYTLNVTDENNCSMVCDVRITYPSMPAPQIGPFCQNDAPYDLSDLLTDPTLMGAWIGPGVSNDVFYPSAVPVDTHDIYFEDQINCVSAMISVFVDERCCPPDYAEINDRKLIGTQSNAVHYETDGILDSDQIIQANTIYDSKLQINLQPKFEVKLGHEFSALIDGCP